MRLLHFGCLVLVCCITLISTEIFAQPTSGFTSESRSTQMRLSQLSLPELDFERVCPDQHQTEIVSTQDLRGRFGRIAGEFAGDNVLYSVSEFDSSTRGWYDTLYARSLIPGSPTVALTNEPQSLFIYSLAGNNELVARVQTSTVRGVNELVLRFLGNDGQFHPNDFEYVVHEFGWFPPMSGLKIGKTRTRYYILAYSNLNFAVLCQADITNVRSGPQAWSCDSQPVMPSAGGTWVRRTVGTEFSLLTNFINLFPVIGTTASPIRLGVGVLDAHFYYHFPTFQNSRHFNRFGQSDAKEDRLAGSNSSFALLEQQFDDGSRMISLDYGISPRTPIPVVYPQDLPTPVQRVNVANDINQDTFLNFIYRVNGVDYLTEIRSASVSTPYGASKVMLPEGMIEPLVNKNWLAYKWSPRQPGQPRAGLRVRYCRFPLVR